MKRLAIWVMFAVGLVLSADDVGMTMNAPWQAGNEPGIYEIYYQNNGSPQLTAELSVRPKTFYQLTWSASSQPADASFLKASVQLGTETLIYPWRASDDWTKGRLYFYNNDAATAKIAFYPEPSGNVHLRIRDLDIEEMYQEMLTDNLLFDTGIEDGGRIAAFWKKTYFSEKTIAGDDHLAWLNGECGIESFYMPVTPGKAYQLSFWAQAASDMEILVIMSLRPPDDIHQGKHFLLSKRIMLSGEWRTHKIDFTIPDDFKEYPDLASRLLQILLITDRGVAGNVRFDHIEFHQK